MTAVEPINWGELLTRCSPSYIEIWKQDEDLHERTGIAFIDSLDVPTLRSMPDLLFIAIIERVCGYIHQTIKSAPFTEERLTLLKPALKFIPTLKTLCKERKPSNVIELLNRLTLALAEPYVALYDYLPALNHFREIIHPCPKADVKLAKLLYYCEGWRFPEIAHWHQRYALIAALMDSSKEELQEDEKAILRNVKEVLKQSLLEGKTDLVSPFYDLLSRIHVEDYFRYHSMKIRLKEALSRNASSQPPRNLQFLLPLSDAVETYFGRCGAYLPPLLPAHDIEALHLLVECCLKLAASNEPEETFKKVQHPLNSPLVQKWMAIIPAFAGSLGSFLPK
jgi:hypothetical protein